MHMPSFYFGVHLAAILIGLGTSPVAPLALIPAVWSSGWAYFFWKKTGADERLSAVRSVTNK